ncbi:MAG: hypothetical protein NTY19_46590 [Planctomycetota bacterium]|nr:hypothetical protein [Planctomycetota bacterium]
MEFLPGPADPAPILELAAAEERLLARYDRPARSLLLEPWEAELLARLVQVWRAHRSPLAKAQRPPTTPRCCGRLKELHGFAEDESGPDRFARRAGLEPRDTAGSS